ncbi:hypothetical protein N2152v2_005497 [Parachlorella kessleri]
MVHYGSPLFEAAATGNTARISSLVSNAGGSVEAVDAVGRTPLFYAAREGHAAAVVKLVRSGARVDATNSYGATPLHAAAREGHVPVIEALLRCGHAAAVDALVLGGARVNAATRNGETPLHMAAEWGHGPVVQALLDAGADPRRRLGGLFGDSSTAAELAQRHGHAQAASLLLSATKQQQQQQQRQPQQQADVISTQSRLRQWLAAVWQTRLAHVS